MAAIQTFKNIQDRILALLDEAGNTSTTLTLVKNAVNAAHTKRLTSERWPFMRWDSMQTLAVVAGQQTYALHSEFFRPIYFWNRTILDYLTEYDDVTLESAGVDWNTDHASALKFQMYGRTEVQNQPSAASVIAVSSSNATDNGARTVTIKGDTADGVRSETITCNSSGAVSFTKIIKVTKSDAWVGTMTLTSNAGAVTNLKLFADEYGRSYQQVFLLNIPDAAETIEYRFYRQPSTLVANNDRPDLPPPFEELLVYDALIELSAYNQYDTTTLRVWSDKRDEWLTGLRQSMTEQAESLQRATNYTSYVPR